MDHRSELIALQYMQYAIEQRLKTIENLPHVLSDSMSREQFVERMQRHLKDL